jgi:glycosyltransferase involved in cell wall biosynthesis
MGNKTINFVVLGRLNFPNGSAQSARIISYSKGIIENGGTATVICTRALHSKSSGNKSLAPSGLSEKINYIYSPGTQYKADSFLRRRFLAVKGLLNAVKILYKMNNKQKISAILFFSTSMTDELFFKMLCKILNIPVIRELNEYPLPESESIAGRTKLFIEKYILTKLYNGIIVITGYLESYYKHLISPSAISIRIPILIDMNRFSEVSGLNSNSKYIAYCGDPTGNKDGVPILLEAFSKIAVIHKDIKLYIIGNSQNSDVLEKLKALAQLLSIESNVVFTGSISYESIPSYLANAELLVLARPSGLQATGGFPTKLGEYLASGKPVVITNVGEIPLYFKDQENIFIAQPDSSDSFAEKVNFALSNPDIAKVVGENGKRTAQEKFDYHLHSNDLINFIQQLNN